MVRMYVNVTRPDDSGDGLTWATAKRNLRTALLLAAPLSQRSDDGIVVNEIWVAAGTYKTSDATRSFTHESFVLFGDVAVYGGFAGTETLLDERDPANNVTVLDGDGGEWAVVTSASSKGTPLLDGFTITGSSWNNIPDDIITGKVWTWQGKGGGVKVQCFARPTFRNCIITNNRARLGGGVCVDDASPVFENCTIINNRAREGGGGVYVDCPKADRAVFKNCTITNNRAGNVCAGESDAIFIDCNIS